MKKKQKIVILVILVLIIVGIIIAIATRKEQDEQKLLKIYNDLNSSENYKFTAEQNDKNKTIVAKKGEKTAIDSYNEESHTTTIVENGNTCYILHDREEYYIYKQNNVEQSILTDWIKEVVDKEYSVGEEKILGKKYLYEEYNGSTMFMKSNVLDISEEDIKTRFYFDKNDDLVYIKTIYGENKQELLKVELSKDVDDSLFKIPSNYAEN